MKEIFKTSRIKFNELLEDARSFLSFNYSQNDKVYSPASPFGQILTVLIGLASKIFYYIEDSLTELNINTAARKSSIIGLAALTGYNAKGASSSSGHARLYYNGKTFDDASLNQIIIPNYSRVYCPLNNLYYLIVSNSEIRFSTLDREKNIGVKLVQGELFEQTFTSTGTPLQTFRINERFFEYVDLDTIKVKVNGEQYDRYMSIYDMPFNSPGFLTRYSVGGGLDIIFGNLYHGTVPPEGSTIIVEYIRSAGAVGNLIDASNVRFDFVEDGYDNFGNSVALGEYCALEVETGLFLGSEPESLDNIKLSAPMHSRSFVLSNTNAYESFLNRMNYFTTVEVFNTFDDDNLDDDNVVYIFLVPNLKLRIVPTDNYFTAPLNSFLMGEVEKNHLLEAIEGSGQVMIGTEFEIIQPTVKKFVCNIIIDYFEGYSKELIRTTIINSLSNYFIHYTRRDRIPKSDLIAIIEGIDGVDSVNVFFIEDPANYSIDSNSYINNMGDIIIGKKDYPLIRGGFIDRSNVKYLEGLSESKPSSLNITFNSQVPRSTNRIKNKSIVSSIRSLGK